MDSINFFRCVSLVLIFCFAGLFVEHLQQPRPHAGQVIEVDSRNPVVLEIKAWPDSKQTAKEGDCPLYGNAPLDSTRSKVNDGSFQLMIDPTKNPTYTTTYCAKDYYPRADRDIPSSGPQVIPNPVEIYPRKTDLRFFRRFVAQKTISALNDLAYLESINPAEFQGVMNELATNTRSEVLRNLGPVVRQWNTRPLPN